jgi:hypothetical protein
VMEAVFCGARPLLPRRLVYPELYPEECLYGDDADFTDALRALLVSGTAPRTAGAAARERLRATYDVRRSVAALDDLVENATARRRRPGSPPCGSAC